MNSHKCSRENWKRFKNCPYFCQTCVFRNWGESPTSRQVKPPKHSKTEFWKNFLNVFHDWKVYPRGSRELSREKLCVTLATRPFTREQVAKINTRARGWNMRLGWLAIESSKHGNTVFEIFQFFVKTKYFLKTPKTLKNLFVFESTNIEHVKTHFIKYNHTNEYGIHWI